VTSERRIHEKRNTTRGKKERITQQKDRKSKNIQTQISQIDSVAVEFRGDIHRIRRLLMRERGYEEITASLSLSFPLSLTHTPSLKEPQQKSERADYLRKREMRRKYE
jgi:hypothetical protein